MTGYRPATALPRAIVERADMQAAITAHDFGTVFRLARELAGISYSKIAAECGIKPERVGSLARGRGSVTSFEKVTCIADALRIPGHMLGLTPRPWEKSEPLPARDRTSEEDENPVERRRFLRAGTGAGLAATLPELTRPAAGRRVGPELPDRLRLRTARLRRLDQVLGGGDTYRVYLGEYQATKALLRDSTYSEQTRRDLLSVLAEQAQQAGWAAFDGGRAADARGLYEESHSAATEAGDTDLAGNALAFLAYQAVSGDQKAGVEIAARSCATIGPDAPAGVRALLHERLAWACAVAGLATECERALAAAETALSTAGDTPQPDWVSWVDTTELQIMTGRCWTELRRPLRAVPVLETALAAYDDTNARDKALYLSWLGDSYLTAGEVEHAATTADRALDLAEGVASVRPRARLTPLLKRLDAHRGLPAVDAVMEKAVVV
ncbi:helix-turn-helix domain-containing protein [Actinacidiphila bryophytorum]|uniref:helix-turn-helix domain-containing protein n=1 Tax=Actinacidiphila bryophytorum TaxID=1436133 RepID=UPI002176C93A|nr:helix-turn-helix domain-containing protein [Actinacidiphila bryophytorum]UWE07687.1 helix-turn-helix domain-containing protein [Actinacidiphila bryophytorum]